MRNKFIQTGFIIAGAAALLVGLAGNVQAIPMSIPADLDAGMQSWIWKYAQSDRDRSLAIPTPFFESSSALAQIAGQPYNSGSRNSRRNRDDESKKSPPLPDQNPAPVRVPDGGTTIMLMGGVFCGLAFLAKKLKA